MKFKALVLLAIFLFAVTGCGAADNSSAESVAKAMVKKLSNDDYENIGNLFYKEDGVYFEDEVFKKLIEQKKLNISGNKKIKVKEIGSEITNSDGNVEVLVQLEIDDDKTFNLKTVQVDGKWYVIDDSFYDKGISIIVPEGAKVKINGNTLSKDYYKDTNINITLKHPSSTNKKMSAEDVLVKGYKLTKVLKGSYDITVEGNKTIKDVIYSYSNRGNINSKNYTYDLVSDDIVYSFTDQANYDATKNQVEDVEKFINGFYTDLFNLKTNKQEFDTMKKYFEDGSKMYDNVKNSYEYVEYFKYTKSSPYKYTSSYSNYTTTYYYEDVKFTPVKTLKVYYCSDDAILVAYDFNMNYKYTYNSSISDKTKKFYSMLKLKKSGDSYIIVEESNLFW